MGERIGQYELLGILGTGGFGTIHRARDTRAGRTVVVRVLGDVSADRVNRAAFLEAVRPYMRMAHPNVAAVVDVGDHLGFPFVVYEYVPGERLAAGRHLGLRRVLDLAIQAADGLAEAHTLGLWHGALTPSSLLVTPQGHLKILDFGLSHWQPRGPGRHTAVRLDERGTALGTSALGYMAPEQVIGDVADHRADVFALGAICYEMLTGRQPFGEPNPAETAVKVAQFVPPAPDTVNCDVPEAASRAVMKALSKSLNDRHGSAAEFAADLRAATAQLRQRDAAGALGSAAAARAGRRVWRLAVLSLLLVTAAAVAAWTWRDGIARLWSGTAGPAIEPVVAVAAFADRGALPRVTVGAGLAEEVARRLGQVPGVTVRGGGSVRALGGLAPAGAGAQTGANVVLTGAISPGRDGWPAFDITVELSTGRDGRSVWSRRYEGIGRDLAATPARIARDVAGRLGIAAPAPPSNSRAALREVDPAAFELYLRGVEGYSDGDIPLATQHFETAVAAAPGLVEAQAALAESLYVGVVFEGRGDYGVTRKRARQIAEEAVTADPDLAAAHLALGLTSDTYPDALAHLRTAVELNPSSVRAWSALADLLRDVDPPRSAAYAVRAAIVDPLQPISAYHEAAAALQIGDPSTALSLIARGQAAAPQALWWDALRQRARLSSRTPETVVAAARSVSDFAPGALVRSIALVRDGRPVEAAEMLGIVLRMNPQACDARALLAAVRRVAGDRAVAAGLASDIQRAADRAPDPAARTRCAAMAAAAAGDAGAAAAWLDRASSDPRALRMFSATSAVLSPLPFIREGLFPWDAVAGRPPLTAALTRLEAALTQVRVQLGPGPAARD